MLWFGAQFGEFSWLARLVLGRLVCSGFLFFVVSVAGAP